MRFNSPKQKYIGFFDGQKKRASGSKIEEKVAIDNLSDIYKHADKLKNTARIYISDEEK